MSSPRVVAIPNGIFEENSYLLWDEESRDGVVVDPGEGAELVLGAVHEHAVTVRAIWLTHAHLDHIWGVDVIRAATGAPVLMHPLDRELYARSAEQALLYGIANFPQLAPPDGSLAHGDLLAVGPWAFEVRHVPGHSPGHVGFIGHGLCLSGDVLFLDSVGRTDLPGSDSGTLLASIATSLLTLPDETRVLPGHGAETTVGRERRRNPFLRGLVAP